MTDDVLFTVHNGLGRITLNRPKALNALTHGMVREIAAALDTWEHDDTVRAVIIGGAGERGLCAGGDIRSIYEDARSGGTASLAFWADEYRLNARIARYPKPYIALMDGLVMGGGVGVSAHGGIRVVTERSRVGMPEVGIGFVPDVGGTYLLSRTPGLLGTHVALTTTQLSGPDAIHCGLADYYVHSDKLSALVDALADGDPADVARSFAEAPPHSTLADEASWIDTCYAHETVEEILESLRDHSEATATQIEAKSPTAVKVALAALRSAAKLPSLEAVLEQEFRISTAALHSPDFAEGIRAQIIDKDRNPRWSPATLAEVDNDRVAAFFAPLGDDELALEGTR